MPGRISVRGVRKRFRRKGEREPSTFKQAFVQAFRLQRSSEWFWALDGIDVEIGAGQMLAIIGRNGSGKSTLLQLVGGIGVPDTGTIECAGRMRSMLDLGLGFHPDLTGEENVYVGGVIYGLTRREIRKRMESIVDFAELARFIRNPLRTYSSGMRLRLAFAVAAHSDPEILLIDEVLAVGDLNFQNKCLARIAEFQTEGCAIMFVTHDINQARRIADNALWLHNGVARACGPPAAVTDQYMAFMETGADDEAPAGSAAGTNGSGAVVQGREVEITRLRLLDRGGQPIASLQSGGSCAVEVEYCLHRRVDAPVFVVGIVREDGQKGCQLHTAAAGVDTNQLPDRGVLRLTFDRLDLCAGEYFLDAGVFETNWAFAYEYQWHALSLSIESESGTEGVVNPPARWELLAR